MQYPREIYRAGQCRVIWGPEEDAVTKREGWTDEKEAMRRDNDREDASPVHDAGSGATASEEHHITSKRRGRPPRVQPITEVA